MFLIEIKIKHFNEPVDSDSREMSEMLFVGVGAVETVDDI